MPVVVRGTLPVPARKDPCFFHHGLLCRIRQPQEKPMGIQVHEGEGSSSQNRKNPHSRCSKNINLEFQPAHCFCFAAGQLLVKVHSHTSNESQIFTRAMEINRKASAFGLLLAWVAFAGTVILPFQSFTSFSCSE